MYRPYLYETDSSFGELFGILLAIAASTGRTLGSSRSKTTFRLSAVVSSKLTCSQMRSLFGRNHPMGEGQVAGDSNQRCVPSGRRSISTSTSWRRSQWNQVLANRKETDSRRLSSPSCISVQLLQNSLLREFRCRNQANSYTWEVTMPVPRKRSRRRLSAK